MKKENHRPHIRVFSQRKEGSPSDEPKKENHRPRIRVFSPERLAVTETETDFEARKELAQVVKDLRVLNPSEDLRAIFVKLTVKPCESQWRKLCARIDALTEEAQSAVAVWLDPLLDHWDDELRVNPNHWNKKLKLKSYKIPALARHWRSKVNDISDITDITALATLINLTYLDLNDGMVSDVSALASLTNLASLNLSGTQVSDVSSLASLTNLASLNLSGTQVSDVSSLASLTNLASLNLSGTQVSDVSSLASLANLASLNLSDTQVSDVSSLASLTNLRILNLNGTQVSDLRPLVSLTNLRTLYLKDAQASDVSSLAKLTNLTFLNLKGTQVRDVSSLAKLTNLTFLITETHSLTNISLTGVNIAEDNLNIFDFKSESLKIKEAIENDTIFSTIISDANLEYKIDFINKEDDNKNDAKESKIQIISRRDNLCKLYENSNLLIDGENFPSNGTPELSRDFQQKNKAKLAIIQREQRDGQPQFRTILLNHYNNKCAVTGCDVVDVLDAAHIIPYTESYDNSECNGIILRTDLHRLFDRGMISFDPNSGRLVLSNVLAQSTYFEFQNRSVFWPKDSKKRPSRENISWHFYNIFRENG